MTAWSLPAWRKSTYSGGGNCVEVADGLASAVAVRDSKNPSVPPLAFGHEEWAAFTGRVKRGHSTRE